MAARPASKTHTGRDQRPVSVNVWDPFIRVFHWSLVVLFGLAWLTEDLQALHQDVGYAILALVLLRLVWGFIGSQPARFASFVRSPASTLAYARDLVAGKAPQLYGHNPLAGVMILALLTMLFATCTSGWLMTLDACRSAEWLEGLHEGLASVTLTLVGLHVLAVAIMSVVHAENLVRTMITGSKRMM